MEAELIVSVMIETLKSFLMGEFVDMMKLESPLTKMKQILETINPKLPEMDKKLVCKLKEICYELDDMLDELVTVSSMNNRDLRDSKTSALRKVRLFFSSRFAQKNASVKANNFSESMNVILQDAVQFSQFNLPEGEREDEKNIVKSKHVFSSPSSSEKLDCVIGRDFDKESVVDMLLRSGDGAGDSFVAIVGVGGLGKTTLAELVYNDVRINQEFQLKMWATVSTEFDATRIQSQLFQLATATASEAEGDTVADPVHLLRTKKYLLVLDDVWTTESSQDWQPLRDLFPTPKGSKCLVTTRSTVAARSLGQGSFYELSPLSDADSWELFKRAAFSPEKQGHDQRLVDIGKTIVSRCAGNPLALRAAGSFLYGQGLSKWLSFLKPHFTNTNQSDGILLTLKLSYSRLSPPLKQCFLYCCLFPKGYCLDKECLIDLWIAEGFVTPANDRMLEDIAEDYFKALVQRSFFQDIKTDSLGEIMSCKMHDLMHDLASSMAEDGAFIASSSSSTISDQTRHVSVVGVKDDTFLHTFLPSLKNIRTYLDFSLPNKIQQPIINSSFLSNAKRLRVLDAHNSNISSLPDTAAQMLHLRYLDLSGNSQLEMLPGSITQLYNLLTLKLTGCSSLKELPRGFGKLVKLRHLDIHGCNKVSHMPLGFSALTCLQTLTMFVVGQHSYASVPDQLEVLKSLSNLKGSLTIKLQTGSSFDAVKTRDAEYLKSMSKLKVLSIQWDVNETVHHESPSDHDALLEGLKPHCNLRSLKVVGFPGVTLPSWAASSANLLNICLDDCPSLHHLPQLSQLPHLKGLLLHKLGSLEYMESDCYLASDPRSRTAESPSFFPSLENLTLSYLPRLKGWWSVVGKGQQVEPYDHLEDGSFDRLSLPSFSCLGQLKIMECPKLVSIPPCPQVAELNLYRFNEALQLILSTNSKQQQHSLRRRVTLDNVGYINCLPLEFHQYISYISIHLCYLETLSPGKEVFTGSMCSLESLQVTLCSRLKSLSGLGWKHLTSLQRLQLSNLPVLDLTAKSEDGEEDVMSWKSLRSLQILELDFLPKLVDIPEGIRHLTSLKTLEIRSCHNLKALPEWIGFLVNLQSLRLEACTVLECLPESMRDLTSLVKLEILRCSGPLRERCQPDGKDWPKICHIPHTSIF